MTHRPESMAPTSLATLRALMAGALVALVTTTAWSHDGRRFQVLVDDGQLVAQGANTGADDGSPAVRPYTGAIHDHWRNSPLIGFDLANAVAPEFDVVDPPATLVDRPLYLSLVSVKKWVNPPRMPTPGMQPLLEELDPGEMVSIGLGVNQVDSQTLGDLLLVPSVPTGGVLDLALDYRINRKPANEIHVLELTVSSPLSSVAPSGSIYVLLSPDGATPAERLHHASLYLEAYLGYQTPEPATVGSALLASLVCCCARQGFAGRR